MYITTCFKIIYLRDNLFPIKQRYLIRKEDYKLEYLKKKKKNYSSKVRR